jgi:sterol desaturase/sphingolipid hydroxylase (fatty acid hydroxylase superfamily)
MSSRHGPVITVGALAILLVSERLWPLRPRVAEPGRFVTNALMGLLASATSLVLEAPLTALATRAVERRRWGLSRIESRAARNALGVLWLDWTLYLWHRAAHLQPQLWRLHLPHHLDPTLDTTTAWRFHALELMASIPVRLLQISLMGVPAGALQLWRQLLLLSILFHHSNLRLPASLDRILALLVMTPRLHGIHHSARSAERNSNWSSGLTLWDHLHGTFRGDGDAASVPIGVEGERPATGFAQTLLLPLKARRSSGM